MNKLFMRSGMHKSQVPGCMGNWNWYGGT